MSEINTVSTSNVSLGKLIAIRFKHFLLVSFRLLSLSVQMMTLFEFTDAYTSLTSKINRLSSTSVVYCHAITGKHSCFHALNAIVFV